jgi:branched-chain amino acid transport system substrate-binding protein
MRTATSIKKALFVFALVIFSIAEPSCAEPKKITIGVILGLTGPAAPLAEALKNGVNLALSHLAPTPTLEVRVIFEDDGLEQKRAVVAAQKLVTIDKVNALIVFSSGSALATAPIAERNKVPLIAIASDPAIPKGKKYSFIYWATPEDEAKLLFDCLKKKGTTQLGLLTLTHPGTLAIRDALRSEVQKSSDAKVLFDEEAISDAKDFHSLISKIKKHEGTYNALIPTFFPGQLALLLKQMRQSGIKEPFYGFEVYDNPTEIKASSGAMNGAIFVTSAKPSDSFLKEYQAKYPQALTFSADTGYDAVNLVVNALKSADPVIYLETLKNYEGAAGKSSSTKDHRFSLPVALKKINDEGVVEDYSCED